MSHDYDNPETPVLPKEIKYESKLRITQLKGYCRLVAALNSKRFILKSDGVTDTTGYGDWQFILSGSLGWFRPDVDDSSLLIAPPNWRELIDERFNVKKIRKQNRKEKDLCQERN